MPLRKKVGLIESISRKDFLLKMQLLNLHLEKLKDTNLSIIFWKRLKIVPFKVGIKPKYPNIRKKIYDKAYNGFIDTIKKILMLSKKSMLFQVHNLTNV